MAYYHITIACGIDLMPSRVLEDGGRAHFITKRFDREAKEVKQNIQTLCGMNFCEYTAISNFITSSCFKPYANSS